MAKSTGPILAMGAITIGNATVVNGKPLNLWQPLAIGITATVFAGAEHIPGAQTIVVGVAWLALVTVLFVPLNGPTPVENFNKWLNQGQKK
jgi:hypothetical protein